MDLKAAKQRQIDLSMSVREIGRNSTKTASQAAAKPGFRQPRLAQLAATSRSPISNRPLSRPISTMSPVHSPPRRKGAHQLRNTTRPPNTLKTTKPWKTIAQFLCNSLNTVTTSASASRRTRLSYQTSSLAPQLPRTSPVQLVPPPPFALHRKRLLGTVMVI